MEKPILIASASLDEHAYEPVRSILEQKGFSVIVYLTDKVLTDEERLLTEINSSGELIISYNNELINPEAVCAAWFRKVNNFSSQTETQDIAKGIYINNEVSYLNDTLWGLYPDKLWLNAPDKMRQANRKLGQLLLARELGFSIPETIVGSNWGDISSVLLSADNSRMVVKMIRGVINENDKVKALYTTPLDKAKVDEIQEYTTPFPGIYQPFIEKSREWRVTTVGENVFASAIYTDESAKDDWRKHQLTDAVRFIEEDLPEGVGEKCIQYLGEMGLKFGAFDFIEKPDGEMVFLECNPNGQYGWLEERLSFPISEAIASELMKIANQN